MCFHCCPQSNDSLEIVPMESNPTIELLSDDENGPANDNENANGNDGNKMPPPAFVPPVKAPKEKKAPAEKKTRSTRSKQPKRRVNYHQSFVICQVRFINIISSLVEIPDQARASVRK